ncbi:hypothetical protein PR202_ga09037 [Eleusine coracana subsp. coracana]|uniref:DUF3444 domain-containing protein n=1 Tax=Eleusine coracana subsp. coracana TaxID=191504 RepID=A0AAV5C2Y4_ELECO|nr:hypothetical protein PR202_ga09037 [Eleusine coracana subsp. coracana]
MSGTEREGIPEGSLELDPAGLPCKLEESFPSVAPECSSAKTQECDTRHAGPSSAKSPHKGSVSARERQDTTCMNAETVAKTPMEETSGHKTGTAGSTGADEDDICNAEYGEQEKRLLQEERPIACGAFKVSDLNDMMTYSSTDAFSHPVEARTTGKNEEYEIIPNLGEIWAVYKNWSTGWTAQDYEKCEYELVEIFGHTESSTEVKLLRKLDGYNVVFMPCKGEESVKTIRKDEYLKFSHQIPCFHLTDENGCKLRGALELDPFSVPKEFLPTSSK